MKKVLLSTLVATTLLGSYSVLAADEAADGSQAIGDLSYAAGYYASAGSADSIAIGNGAVTEGISKGITFEEDGSPIFSEKNGYGAIAIGSGAYAKATYGVALGADSIANREPSVLGYDPSTGKESTATDSFVWQSNAGEVSVGGLLKLKIQKPVL